MDCDTAFTVTVDEVLYRSSDGRFSVLAATPDDHVARDLPGGKCVLVGDLRESVPGETLRVRGRFEDHKQFGRRFRVETFTPVTPTTEMGIARYLGSGLIPASAPRSRSASSRASETRRST